MPHPFRGAAFCVPPVLSDFAVRLSAGGGGLWP